MKERVVVVGPNTYHCIQKEINEDLNEIKGTLIDIKFSTSSAQDEYGICALIIYEPEDEE